MFGGVIAPFVNPDYTGGHITSKQILVLQFKSVGNVSNHTMPHNDCMNIAVVWDVTPCGLMRSQGVTAETTKLYSQRCESLISHLKHLSLRCSDNFVLLSPFE